MSEVKPDTLSVPPVYTNTLDAESVVKDAFENIACPDTLSVLLVPGILTFPLRVVRPEFDSPVTVIPANAELPVTFRDIAWADPLTFRVYPPVD